MTKNKKRKILLQIEGICPKSSDHILLKQQNIWLINHVDIKSCHEEKNQMHFEIGATISQEQKTVEPTNRHHVFFHVIHSYL